VPLIAKLPHWFVDWRVLRAMRYQTGGTVLACRLALEHGIAINLGGGYHHAAGSWGSGFCVYADIPLAAATLHREGRAGRVLVVDLDAHQGDGTAAAIAPWPWASILDVYEEDLFPRTKQPEDFPIPVPAGLGGAAYLEIVRQAVPRAIDEVRPDLVIYNAGSDPYVDDPLTRLCLTKSDVAERDLLVATLTREHQVPLAMVLSGGYASDSWRIHADGIAGILSTFDTQFQARQSVATPEL
jgi:histone deacetylase 11